ncbi:MAG: hypothetical protein BWY08_00951 [Bacteroidetes bacterium ADurb.Bin174]|nr:MAG: hypothetical protein BWY08_00951 [Bacteroidetes bacterium ADurb.Bin174]
MTLHSGTGLRGGVINQSSCASVLYQIEALAFPVIGLSVYLSQVLPGLPPLITFHRAGGKVSPSKPSDKYPSSRGELLTNCLALKPDRPEAVKTLPISLLAWAFFGASCPVDHVTVNSNKTIASKFLFMGIKY